MQEHPQANSETAPADAAQSAPPRPAPVIENPPAPKPATAGWKGHLLQFVLMFLAIFFGFLADNLREARADKLREKKYIRSIINDLKADTAKLTDNILYCERLLDGQDSALAMLYTQYDKAENADFFHFLGAFRTIPIFVYNDATIGQLKNSGGFLSIGSEAAKDSIMLYDAWVKQVLINETIMSQILRTTESSIAAVFNLGYFRKDAAAGRLIPAAFAPTRHDHILSDDRRKWAELYNQLLNHQAFLNVLRRQRVDIRQKATNLIGFLEKEYRIS